MAPRKSPSPRPPPRASWPRGGGPSCRRTSRPHRPPRARGATGRSALRRPADWRKRERRLVGRRRRRQIRRARRELSWPRGRRPAGRRLHPGRPVRLGRMPLLDAGDGVGVLLHRGLQLVERGQVRERDGRGVERLGELVGEFLRRLEALVRVPLESLAEPGVEGGGEVGPHAARHGELRRRDGGEGHRDALVRIPDGPPRQTLVGHAAERPQIPPGGRRSPGPSPARATCTPAFRRRRLRA